MTLTEFLLARIEEDEAEFALIPDPVIAHEGDCCGTLCPGCGHCCHSSEECTHDCDETGGGCLDATSELPSLHRRMLAECEAKRRIVDLHIEGDALKKRGWVGFRSSETLRLLARPYAGHAEFNPKWAV